MVAGSMGVLGAPDRFMPIGIAQSIEWYEPGVALWRLTFHGAFLDLLRPRLVTKLVFVVVFLAVLEPDI
jgi:hypothetical protein